MHDPKGGRPPGLLRAILKRDLRGRPVETAPFSRRRPNSGDRLKAAILLGSQIASKEAQRMLALDEQGATGQARVVRGIDTEIAKRLRYRLERRTSTFTP
jgi:hypothetical protein